jgi:hypothetical protein
MSAAINAAITDVNAAGGGIVQIRGQYTTADLPSSILMKTGVWLRGEGFGTVLQLAAGTPIKLLQVTNCRLSDMYIDGSQMNTTDASIVVGSSLPTAANSDDVIIDNLWSLDNKWPDQAAYVWGWREQPRQIHD